ncbi:MAG: RsmB/NOP family class I SAM-dependent RNA methyltransferase [Anaerolineales bacterium]|nr:RsmB/NOP family class I SAM-dependent RNA methyltransferase [Anaerolineales bacterium]
MTTPFPNDFITEINRLLGEQSSRFWDNQETTPTISGLRVNTLKTNPELFRTIFSAKLKTLPWADDGFQLPQGSNPGKHPFHSAGLYYLQEPSAMAPAAALDPQPGELVLDLCAAPGGKATQILSLMENQGLLIANDSNPRRVQALARNIERWGARNTVITNEIPRRLAEHFGPVFDRVLVDAPCSGEGTFRIDPGEIKKWSINFSKRCKLIQDEILWFAGKMVRPGGILVYSTCTFNQQENEGSVMRFLQANTDFVVDPIPLQPGFSTGIPLSKADPGNLKGTVRIWPHLAPGEGHFIARLRKSENSVSRQLPRQSTQTVLTANQLKIYKEFFDSSLKLTPGTKIISPGSSSLSCFGNQLYLFPPNTPQLEGLHIHHWGWSLGMFKGDRFRPSSALASGLTREDSQIVIEFPVGDPNLISYLRGSPIRYPGDVAANSAWVLVTVEGFPLGWGKIVQGRLKSHLPSWLRHT